MSLKLSKRLSSKKKKPPYENAQTEVLQKLGLEAFKTAPLDPASMLGISTWTTEIKTPTEIKELPKAFLQRLWLLSPDARSPCCKPSSRALNNSAPEEMTNGLGEESQHAINPLDLVTAVFMSSNTFLQQEMATRMMQCKFAVPLILPSIEPEEPSQFLLWPLRAVMSPWKSHSLNNNSKVQEGYLASTYMPMISCMKFGHCVVSKSQVLNYIVSGLCNETFIHKEMDGGQLHRKLSDGLVEIGWSLPTGDAARDNFPVPVVISNLRGDASKHEKCLMLLCQASSAVIVFCGNLREKDKQLLASCKDVANKLILVDLSDNERNENSVVGFVDQYLEEDIGLPEGNVLQGRGLSEEELANRLSDTLKGLLPDKLKLVTLEAAAKLAAELGLGVDEGTVCKNAMATAEEVLKGLDEGPALFREKQLPLQGHSWSKLAEIEKTETKLWKEAKIDPKLQKENIDLSVKLSGYKMTPAMKIFTDALSTRDIMERTYFISWMKLKLQLKQTVHGAQDLSVCRFTEKKNGMPECSAEPENEGNDELQDSDSFYTNSSVEEEGTEEPPGDAELQVSNQQLDSEPTTHDPVTDQQEYMMSDEKEIQRKAKSISSFEEQISDPVFENQNNDLESGETGILNHQLTQQDEPQLANSDLESEETRTLSHQSTQQDEPELTQVVSDVTSSTEQQLCPDVSTEPQVDVCSTLFDPDPSSLGLEHFLREMGLIFELTHINPGSGSHNVLRLPSLAADMLLYGIPLELMDGDASNIPMQWLGCVFAELKSRLPHDQCRARVLTNLGVHHARNAEVLYSLFGIKFPEGRKRSTKGVYMVALCLPDTLRADMGCDLLLLIDVEGLRCSVSQDDKINTQIHDNEIATVATGLSDVLMQNISSEFETDFTVLVNALLRIKECGSVPNCPLLIHNEGVNGLLQASQLKRVSDMLQIETGDRENNSADNQYTKTTCCLTFVNRPWPHISLSEPVDTQYSSAVLKLKKSLFGALTKCGAKSEAPGLPEFMVRLSAVWDAVKKESFSFGLQSTDRALAFSLLCTAFSHWEIIFQDHMDSWLRGATKKIIKTNADAAKENDLMNELKDEAKEDVKREMDKLRSKVETYFMNDDLLNGITETFKPVFMNKISDLQEQASEEIIQRLESITENHCCSTQMKKFQTLLQKEQDLKLQALVEKSRSDKVLLEDTQLEKEFEDMWSNVLSNFDFRSSETDDITPRVTNILMQNLINRGLQKHMTKLGDISKKHVFGFHVNNQHFGQRTRLKQNNRQQKLDAQQLASNVIEEYNQFVEDKCSLAADFSDSYITEMLQNVEKALTEKSLEIRSVFEVDLKVYLCTCACHDFQKLHDRYAKDAELLTCITATKSTSLAEFIYWFRKRDQCQRAAQAFVSMVVKPTVLDYIYKPLGAHITEEIRAKEKQYQCPRTFNQGLLEDLIKEENFENFLEYLLSYDSFIMRRIQETVMNHLSEAIYLDTWMQRRLGEIVGNVASAVSQAAEGTRKVLSEIKPLLERVCLILGGNVDMDVARASLNGPLFRITTEWDRFVTYLMELLAEMRLDFAQRFSQKVDATQLLNCLPVLPQQLLFDRVKGCDKRCPLCGASCEVEEMEHKIHSAVLHRPKCMLPDTSSWLPCISCPESMIQDDTTSVACNDLQFLYPDWNISPGDPNNQMPSAYLRYMLVKFNENFATEYARTPAVIPEEWEMITEEEALASLREVFSREPVLM